ncbi:hypothetical protein IV203_030684 [Nitzschia inconspicua]|uniref:Uncharacterized protein n=1 Tax=Nitzschia inconspicua TaxID=303405 RepID=A0A9K3LVS0_9STRA|nr:hypothetical protein IV203_030684 [Nitzschia inconspicua]
MEKTVAGDFSISGGTVRFEEIPAEGQSRNEILRYRALFVEKDSSPHTPSSPLTTADWIRLMIINKDGIAQEMTRLLKEVPFASFRFETPGVSVETVHSQPLEFVLVNDPHLGKFAAQEDPDTFAEHLQCANSGGQGGKVSPGPAACAFGNLGGDAILIAPRNWEDPSSKANYHGHLANFVRGASIVQIIETWELVASTLHDQLLGEAPKRLKSKPLWFSTAGDGVAWLHFRLDSRPKYYHYDPYRTFSKR